MSNNNPLPLCFHLNIDGMNTTLPSQKTKIKALEEFVLTADQYIPYFIVTETHLKSYHFNAEVACENYDIIRADRPLRSKGGVAIYLHNNLIADKTYTYADQICQAAAVYNKKLNLLIIGIYRPPVADEKSFTQCIKIVQEIINNYAQPDIQIHGDFNMPFIDWNTRDIDTTNRRISEQNSAKKLIEFMETNLLLQLVNIPTRKDSVLDLILTNNSHAVHSVTIEETQISDHNFVHCYLLYNITSAQLKTPPTTEKSALDKCNFNKADWNTIRTELKRIDWNNTINSESDSVDEMFDKFLETLTKTCTDHCPQHKHPPRKRDRYISKPRRSLLRIRRRLNAKISECTKLKPTNFQDKLNKLNKKKENLELKIRDSIRKESEDKEREAIAKIKKNPRAFYTYAKQNCKTYTSVGPLLDDDNKLQSDPTVMSNIMQQQYKKSFSDPNSGTKRTSNVNIENIRLEDFEFTEEDIIKAINDIPLTSAPGPDKIPACLLKECKIELAPALYIIWRKSLDTGHIPSILKKQTIVPIHKKESKAVPANYRPISLTSHIIKLFERVLRRKLVAYLETNNLLSKNQHGFRPGRSCLTQLLHHLDSIISILEKNENADVIYLDLSKAFDKVNHNILMHKLENMGISGKINLWLKNFLTNRTQNVVIDGATSSPTDVLSGVPQGTVLGPVLFIVYMNDMSEIVQDSIIKCFADDSKLIKNIKNLSDRNKLMEDLKAVLKWTSDNSMQFNEGKFQLLQHGHDKSLKLPYDLSDKIKIESSNHVKDLGVHVSEDLTWRHHINTTTTNATTFAAWIFRTIKSRDPDVMLLMFKSFVLSRLEYSSPLWNPMLKTDIMKLESVQRSFTAKLNGVQNQDYWNRLKSLKLYSLQRRRERFMLIHLFKIYRNLAPNDLEFKFTNHIRLGAQCQRRSYPNTSASVKTLRYNSFSCVAPRLFNIIPGFIKKAENLQTFKSQLDSLLLHVPDTPPTAGYQSTTGNSLVELVSCINRRAAQMKSSLPGADEEVGILDDC